MTTRPLTIEEYKLIMENTSRGFITVDNKIFRSNDKLNLALFLQANLGLRISDVLQLKVSSFKNGKLETIEKKTKKLQYRSINSKVIEVVKDYAIENGLKANDLLFNRFSVRAVQKQLKKVTDYLELSNISTHSFRKMYATLQYENSNNNLELIKELLNHSSIATTQRYIRISQEAINKASEEFIIM